MKIGIDIDDTLSDIKDKLTKAAQEYAISLNKNIENKDIEIVDIYNNGNIYQKLYGFNYDELKYFLGTIQEEITNNASVREYCVDIIKKLHEEGNEIFIITARDTEFHVDPYKQSEIWLNNNSIYFDKLIVNARDKVKVCLENNIDLLIDDSISNCINVQKSGINAIRICNKKFENLGIKEFYNWNEIYGYIKEME